MKRKERLCYWCVNKAQKSTIVFKNNMLTSHSYTMFVKWSKVLNLKPQNFCLVKELGIQNLKQSNMSWFSIIILCQRHFHAWYHVNWKRSVPHSPLRNTFSGHLPRPFWCIFCWKTFSLSTSRQEFAVVRITSGWNTLKNMSA